MTPEEVQTLMNVQSRAFKDCLEIFVAKFDRENAELRRTVADLEKNLSFRDRMNEDLIKNVKSIEKKLEDERVRNEQLIGDLQFTVGELTDKLAECEARLNYQDDQSRRNNIRISGLPEDANETWEITQQKVAALLKDRLEVPDAEIERAHRTGKRSGSKPRVVVAKLLRYGDREKALRNSAKLKPAPGTGADTNGRNMQQIYVNEDLCAASLQKRREKLPELRQARRENKFARFIHTRLVVRDNQRSALGSDSTWGGPRSGTDAGVRGEASEVPAAADAGVSGEASVGTASTDASTLISSQGENESSRVLRSGAGKSGQKN